MKKNLKVLFVSCFLLASIMPTVVSADEYATSQENKQETTQETTTDETSTSLVEEAVTSQAESKPLLQSLQIDIDDINHLTVISLGIKDTEAIQAVSAKWLDANKKEMVTDFQIDENSGRYTYTVAAKDYKEKASYHLQSIEIKEKATDSPIKIEGIDLEKLNQSHFQEQLTELGQAVAEEEVNLPFKEMNDKAETTGFSLPYHTAFDIEPLIEVDSSSSTSSSESSSVATSESVTTFANERAKQTVVPSLSYTTHVQNVGWQPFVTSPNMSGTVNRAFRLEGIKINLPEELKTLGNIEYRTHIQNIGWEANYAKNGSLSGTENRALRLEAIQIKLTGELEKQYDIYYRVHAQNYGWLGWAKNDNYAGTEGKGYRLEAIEIQLVTKGSAAPGSTEKSFVSYKDTPVVALEAPILSYSTHIQNVGWQAPVQAPKMSGTENRALRLEGIKINLPSSHVGLGDIEYRTHIQNVGWESKYSSNGQFSGTENRALRLEGIQIRLTKQLEKEYDVYYRVHVQNHGWLDWAKNDQMSGSQGPGLRLEGIEIQVVKKGQAAPGKTEVPFVTTVSKPVAQTTSIQYASYLKNQGWTGVAKDGQTSGGSGQTINNFQLKLAVSPTIKGNVQYSGHFSRLGWVTNKSNGQTFATNANHQLEAMTINLTDDMDKQYDIYYRANVEGYGWLDWASNGQTAGTIGAGKRLEAYEVKLVKKGQAAPGKTDTPFVTAQDIQANAGNPGIPPSTANNQGVRDFSQLSKIIFLDPGHGGKDSGAAYFGISEKNLNLSVSKLIEQKLENAGYTVIMSRTTDVFVDHTTERSTLANATNADIFVSVHFNAMPTINGAPTTANGIETYWYEYDPNYQPKINAVMHENSERLVRSQKLAQLIQDSLISKTGAFNRGVRRDTFAVLRETATPAVLLELGFMNNLSDNAKMRTAAYQEQLADAVVKGIQGYYSFYE